MRRALCLLLYVIFLLSSAAPARAQTPAASAGQSAPESMQMAGHDHMTMAGPLGIADARDGSGTSWLPDATTVHAAMTQRGVWMLMLHGQGFLQYLYAGTDRGDEQFGSVNWAMGMARRPLAGGALTFRAMLSLEPLTVGRCGYPDLLQSGESCRGAALHDRQHPHDLFMETAVDYRRAINESVAFEIYGASAGEPALGPVGYPHRPSGAVDPVAPIGHHWLDSTHVSFGVVTGGVYGRRWKAEASAFNGREPDDWRYGFDLAALDSWSARVWLLPSSAWAVQASAGRLRAVETRPDGSAEDLTRVTASASYARTSGERRWTGTLAWGRNIESDHASSAWLAEGTFEPSSRGVWYARLEVVGKSGTDLAVPDAADPIFTVAKLRGGYTRWIWQGGAVAAGVGASAGLAVVPRGVAADYGGRVGGEAAVYFTLRPR